MATTPSKSATSATTVNDNIPSTSDIQSTSNPVELAMSQADGTRQSKTILADALRRLTSRLSPQSTLFVIATVTGVVIGVCAGVFKLAINSMASLFTSHIHNGSLNWILLGLPAIGFILAWLFQKRWVGHRLSHGTDQIAQDVAAGRYYLRPRFTYSWMIAGTLTLGMGGSAGSEGPIASTGAAIGSNLARIAGLSPTYVRILLGCGAGAGIAAIFKAPLGGFLFTLEVLKLELGTLSVMALLLACLVAALVAYATSGFTVDLGFIQAEQFDLSAVPWMIGLGIVAGFYSLYYSTIMKTMKSVYDRLGRWWLMSLVCGLFLGVILFFFPALYGEGYNVMQELLNGNMHPLFDDGLFNHISPEGWHLALMCLALVLLKSFACSATTDGGVAGDFAPTLYAGCIVGLLYATVANTALGAHIPVGSFAFLGMAGVMAGVIRAPFMAIFLTAEMCNGYLMLLPLSLVGVISIGIVRIFRPAKLYHNDPLNE